MMTLTRNSNVNITLTTRKNIMKVRRFKEIMIFKIIFEKSKKIFKSNDFWMRNVVKTTIFRREKSNVIIHEMKIKNMFSNIKNKKAKMMKRIDDIMHSGLQIEEMKWLVKENEKKKYVLIMIWMRDAEIANKLIQLKLIMKSNIKTMKYYERNCRIKQCIQCQKYDH